MIMLLDSGCTTFLKLIAETDVLDAKPWFFDVKNLDFSVSASKCSGIHMWVSDPPCAMHLIARWFLGLQQDDKLTLENA